MLNDQCALLPGLRYLRQHRAQLNLRDSDDRRREVRRGRTARIGLLRRNSFSPMSVRTAWPSHRGPKQELDSDEACGDGHLAGDEETNADRTQATAVCRELLSQIGADRDWH